MARLSIAFFLILSSCAKVPGVPGGSSTTCDPYVDVVNYTYPDGIERKSIAEYCVIAGKSCTVYRSTDGGTKFKECL